MKHTNMQLLATSFNSRCEGIVNASPHVSAFKTSYEKRNTLNNITYKWLRAEAK